MNLRKIVTVVLTAVIILSQGTTTGLTALAQGISLGSEEYKNTEDEAFYAQGKERFSELIEDHAVYALLYKKASANVVKEPSAQAAPVVNLRVGHQVSLNDVEYVDGEVWYQVETLVDGKEYTGYMADEVLISADEEFAAWRTEWMPQNSTFSINAYGAGSTDLSLFPKSYRSYIKKLTEAHPNWTFVPLDTGLEWETVIENEMYPTRNLVPLYSIYTWKSTDDPYYKYDEEKEEWFWEGYSGGAWAQASESIVRYYMDPRNFLNEESVFQFELLSFNSSNHTKKGVEAILKNTFMSKANLEGTELTYAEAFLEIGKELDISPYHLAGRVRQEQGVSGTSELISGTYPGYEGYYNYFNIMASGLTREEVIENGLIEAKQGEWTSRYAALYGGSEKVGKNYISVGQNTLYLQKFDVDNTDGVLYWHQYMQNLSAAASESKTVKKGYEEMGVLNNGFVFSVPVYKNMPEGEIKLPTETLEAPVLKTSLKEFTEVTLKWDETAGAQGYEIYRSTQEKSGYKKVKTLNYVGDLQWKQKMAVDKVYYYKVRGYKFLDGKKKYSKYSSPKKVSSVIPVPEGSALKQNSYTKVTMSWEKAKDVTGYEIYRKKGKNGTYESLVDIADVDTLNYADTTVSPKNTYFYKVRSYKVLGENRHYSEFGEEQQVDIKMETPVLNSASLSDKKKLTLSWKKTKWVSGYQIYRSESEKGTYQLLQEIPGQKNVTYIDETAEADHVYYYKVRSYVNVNESKKYSSFSKVVLGEVKLTKPVFKPEYTALTNKITLKWSKNPIASGYEIQQKVGKKWNTVATLQKNSASKTITKLQAGTSYQFRIRAYKNVGEQTFYSSYVTLKTTTAPEQAVITNVKSDKKKWLKVNWNPVQNATGYQMQISLNKDFKTAEKYKTVTYELKKGTAKAKTIKKLTSGKKYHVRVRAYRIENKQTVYGEWSARKSLKVK